MRASCATIVALCIAGSSFGQGFPFQESRLSGAALLFRHEGVQAHLKITKEQNDKFRDTMHKVQKKHAAEFEKLEKMETGRDRSIAKRELAPKVIAEVTKELPTILTPAQLQRLQQLSLQQGGMQAFDEKLVQDAIKLTKEQRDRIEKIREDTKKEYMAVRQDLNLGFEESKGKDHDLKKRTVENALTALTDEQRKIWNDLLGEPFDFVSANDLKKPAPAEKKPTVKSKPVASAEILNENLDWVAKGVQEIQPTDDERKSDKIGWTKSISQGLELGKKHNRPVILHTYNDGRIHDGRC